MAGITKRGGMWYAVYKQDGRTVQKALKIRVERGEAGRVNKQLARQAAALIEQTARGACSIAAAVDAIRSAGRAMGAAGIMQSIFSPPWRGLTCFIGGASQPILPHCYGGGV